MADDLISGNSVLRAAARVRAERAKAAQSVAEPITLNAPTKTSSQVRARLNFIPDNATLHGLIDQALSALSRGVRWARGSIINLIV